MMMRSILQAVLAVFALGSACAAAQSFPARSVRMIIPFTAAGSNDIVARTVGQKLAEKWKQQVVADNRAGANGIIGTDMAAKSAPDGHTLVIVSTSFTMNPSITKVPFDPVRDFAPISLIAEGALIFTAHPSFPARGVRDLVRMARAQPGALQYASSGHGGVSHLAVELLQRMASISLAHVPYKGSSAAAIDVIGGQVPIMISSVSPALPYLKSGRLRAIGIGSPKRSSLLPDVPTVAEQGVPGYDSNMWWGIMAPSATSPDIVRRINDDIGAAIRDQDVQKRIADLGMTAVNSTPDEFAKIVAGDLVKWGKIIREVGIKN
jgi:tripartite-type tricarboxylate transporter receptor subunit TctC